MKRRRRALRFVVCLDDGGYRASLILRRLYRVLADAEASGRGLVRVIDESGEDYVYPGSMFAAVGLSEAVRKKLARAS